MRSLLILLLLTTASTFGGDSCDNLGVVLYEDMACRPVKSSSSPCPSNFECNGLKKSKSECFYQGKTYSTGQKIDKNSIGFSCEFGCFCTSGKPNQQTSAVSCAQFGCGEWSGVPPSPGCYRQYNLETCCSVGENCEKNVTICRVDGVDYKEGERFNPKDSCHVCVCRKGFKGKFEAPFCKRSGCDAQLRNQKEVQMSCAPIYVKREGDGDKLCCPREWTCPDGTENFETHSVGNVSTFVKCKYGEQFLNVGDVFTKSVTGIGPTRRVKCECKVPPLVTCRQI